VEDANTESFAVIHFCGREPQNVPKGVVVWWVSELLPLSELFGQTASQFGIETEGDLRAFHLRVGRKSRAGACSGWTSLHAPSHKQNPKNLIGDELLDLMGRSIC
jgi:hypothetical protein